MKLFGLSESWSISLLNLAKSSRNPEIYFEYCIIIPCEMQFYIEIKAAINARYRKKFPFNEKNKFYLYLSLNKAATIVSIEWNRIVMKKANI